MSTQSVSESKSSGYFQPLELVRDLSDDYLRYLMTTFPVKGDLLARLSERLRDDATPWEGPFVTISQPYKQGNKVADVLRDLRMSEHLAQLMPPKFYRHQEETIKNIVAGRNTIITTGTGSGKTESFLLPILDHCIRHEEKGVKAILLYPMNSLADDQADRLRKYLYILNPLLGRGGLTFARYTGGTPTRWDEKFIGNVRCPLSDMANTDGRRRCPVCSGNYTGEAVLQPALTTQNKRVLCCHHESPSPVVVDFEALTREDIRNSPPDILITNYKMLDLLLLRQEDRVLFSGSIRYIVADELHSYLGAQGTELSCLLRRLVSRIRDAGGRDPLFVGASATIVSDSVSNLQREVAAYATSFFGAPLTEKDVFTGDTEERVFTGEAVMHTVPETDPGISLEGRGEEFLKILKSICPEEKIPKQIPDNIDERRFLLGNVLQHNGLFRLLSAELKKARHLREIEEDLKNAGYTYSIREVLRILTLSTKAYDPVTKDTTVRQPFARCQVHFVARTLDGVYKCTCCNTLYFSPRLTCPACEGSVEPLAVCRSCGEEFYRVDLEQDDYQRYINQNTEEVDDALDDDSPWTVRRSAVIREAYGFSDTAVWITENEIPHDRQGSGRRIQRCTSCGALKYRNEAECCPRQNLKDVWLFTKISRCPHCLAQRGPFAQPVTTIYLSPRTAAPTLFSLNHTLIPDENHRKQLIFSDSRQETARLAGFMDDLHLGLLIRNLIYRVIADTTSENRIPFFDLQKRVTEKIFELGYRDNDEDEVFGLERDRLSRKIQEELAGCFDKRYGIEKVGLIRAYYNILDSESLVEDYDQKRMPLLKTVKEITGADAQTVRDALAMILDHMRHEGGIRCLKDFRPWGTRPAAFVELTGTQRSTLYYSISALKRRARRSGSFYNHTAFTKFISKTFNISDGVRQNEIIGCLFRFLQQKGLLTEERIGQRRNARYQGRGWMVDETKVSYGLSEEVNECPRCGERSCRSMGRVSCFSYYCDERESMVRSKADILSSDDMYTKRYTEEHPVRLITAEDHGGLDNEDRKKNETLFKQGKIDVICCTPTLELGVDIGDLSIVGLYRSPPSPASYVQRVGRAGRRERISLAITFLGQNPIDQYYRRRPLEMIGGNIRVPYVNLENDTVVSRHVNSLILETLVVANEAFILQKRVLEFRNNNQIEILRQLLSDKRREVTEKIQVTFTGIPWLSLWKIEQLCDEFPDKVRDAVNKWGERREILLQSMNEISQKNMTALQEGKIEDANEYRRRLNEIQRQLVEMQGEERGESDLFSYLSGVGVLPTYTFPAKLVRIQDRWGSDLGNDRPACIAITEFAPGLSVEMRKGKYRVRGFDVKTSPEPSPRTYYICDPSYGGCGRYASQTPERQCPVCRSQSRTVREVKAWNPHGLVLDREERISVRGDEEFKVADVEYFLQSSAGENEVQSHRVPWGTIRDRGASTVLLLVRKTSDMSDRIGFNICPACGWCLEGDPRQATSNHNRLMDRHTQCDGVPERRGLWHEFRTNAIEIIPEESIASGDRRRWLVTLKNALCRTAEIVINAAEGELNGFIAGNSLVIFDNVDGGVGYTRQMINQINRISLEMALTILSCDCETGCPKCIFSSRRKYDIIRGDVDKTLLIPLCQQILREARPTTLLPAQMPREVKYFEALGAGKIQGNVSCWFSTANDKRPATWLRDLILTAKVEICLTSLYITDDKLEWDDSGNGSFSELLIVAKSRGVKKVRVVVRPPESVKHRKTVRRLIENGIEVRGFSRPGSAGLDAIAHCKMVVVDGNTQSETAAGVALSANLSAEVQKNVDSFCLGYEKQWVQGLQQAFEKIWVDARPLG